MGQFFSSPRRDTLHIQDLLLLLPLVINDDSQPRPHAVLLSLDITHDVSRTARSDDLTHSIDYAPVYATLVDHLPTAPSYPSLEALLDCALDLVFSSHPLIAKATVRATLRDTSPRCTVEATRTRRAHAPSSPYRYTLGGLVFPAIVGVNPLERIQKQPVVLDILVRKTRVQDRFPFFDLSASVRRTFAASRYLTIEALASAVARHVLEQGPRRRDDEVSVHLSKPNALPLAASARVQVTRRRADLTAGTALPVPQAVGKASSSSSLSSSHTVALALGSNLGDSFANIETALRLLEIPASLLHDLSEGAEISVVDTSFMYETAPMYVTDQPRFVNCACMIETNMSPTELLRLLKAIETAVGRVPSMRNGPRAVDLDILLYDDRHVDTRPLNDRASLDNLVGELVVPHPRMCEREFVLRPLNDMIPDYVHPIRHQTIRTLLDEVVSARTKDDGPMFKVMPFPKYPFDDTDAQGVVHGIQVPPTATHWVMSPSSLSHGRPRKTHLMAILNVTPDSFSDGSQHNTTPAAVAYATSAISAGADMIDVGGYSTRPGAAPVPTDEELWRVIPVIEAIRTHPDTRVNQALVSVDTFRWEVVEEAVRKGANCVNDVYAFAGPTWPPDEASAEHIDKMRGVVRRLGVPVVLMHSRGDAGAHKTYEDDLVGAVRTELGSRVDAIVRGPGGVRRWLVMVDPGIGFSKPVQAQMALMRDLAQVTAAATDGDVNLLAGYPMLVGPSRKSVLGAVLAEGDEGRKTTGKERVWATAAAVACAVQQGANVVRVHDVPEMRDVVSIATAIWSR